MNRFIRLDTCFVQSEWLAVLSAEARLAWVMLLCHVKNAGRDGRAKSIPVFMAAHAWFLGEESIRQMLMAAEKHGALTIENSDWIVNKWAQYQGDPTAAERQAKFKERQKSREKTAVTKKNGGNGEKRVSNAEKETEKETENSVPIGTGEDAASPPHRVPTVDEAFGEVEDVLKRVHERFGWPPPRRQDVLRHAKADSALRQLVAEFGREESAAMFVWTHETWKGRTSWPALFDQRYAVRDAMGGGTAAKAPPGNEWRWAKKPKDKLHFYMPGETDAAGRMLEFVLGPPDWPPERRRTTIPFRRKLFAECVESKQDWWSAHGLEVGE